MSFARLVSAAVLAAGAFVAGPASAAEFRSFDRAAFTAAQAQGKPILVEVAAWWCPVCHSQEGTVKRTVAASDYDKLIVFKINYDRQKDEWKSFGVDKQGTLIGFHGTHEVGRIRFRTDKTEIANLLATTVHQG